MYAIKIWLLDVQKLYYCLLLTSKNRIDKRRNMLKIYSWKYPQRTDKVEQYTGVIVSCFDIQSVHIYLYLSFVNR